MPPQGRDEALERGLVGEPGLRVEERQPAGVVRIREHRQHPAAEEARQQVDVHEEIGPGGDPSRSVGRQPSAGHDHVHVRMMGEGRAPGVQHGGDADPGAEAPGIGGDGERRLGRRLHQEIVDHALVLPGDVAQLARQRVDDVKVRNGQQLPFPVGQPSARGRGLALRTMSIPARVESDVRMAARRVLAACDVAAERRRAAALDRAHHLQLVEARMAAVGLAPRGTVLAEDVRELQNGPNHDRRRYRAGGFLRSAWPACGAA